MRGEKKSMRVGEEDGIRGANEEGKWIGRERRGRRKEDERWKDRKKTCGN